MNLSHYVQDTVFALGVQVYVCLQMGILSILTSDCPCVYVKGFLPPQRCGAALPVDGTAAPDRVSWC